MDGILLFPSAQSLRTILRLKAVGIPYVLMARHLDRDEDDWVVSDDEQGGYLAALHLIQAGHKRIGFLSSFDVVYSSKRRENGFYRALEESGIPRENGLVACQLDQDQTLSQLETWKLIGVTGVFLFCDEEAWRAVSLLQTQGQSIPHDMAIVGFDNIQGNLPIPAPLCSISYSIPDMAQSGINLLRRRIHEPNLEPQHVVFPVQLVCRGSCGAKDCTYAPIPYSK